MESSSRYVTPCFDIPKKDRSLQLIQDYRKLNWYTIKKQDTITTDWRSNQQTQRCEILQQIGFYLGIQQYKNQRRQKIESGILNKQKAI